MRMAARGMVWRLWHSVRARGMSVKIRMCVRVCVDPLFFQLALTVASIDDASTFPARAHSNQQRPANSAARRVRSVVRCTSAWGYAMAASRKQQATDLCVAP